MPAPDPRVPEPQPAAPLESGGRFADRALRLSRQQESRVFSAFLTPIATLLGLGGLAGMAGFGIFGWFTGEDVHAGFRASVGAAAVPVIVATLRLLRGHHRPELREP